MVQSSHIVVTTSISSLYWCRTLHHGSVNECELSLAIYVQDKNISRKSSVHEKVLCWTLLSMKYFLSNNSELWYSAVVLWNYTRVGSMTHELTTITCM